MATIVFLFLVFIKIVTSSLVRGNVNLPIPNEALNQSLYEDVIDPDLCHEQIRLIRNNTFLTMFCKYNYWFTTYKAVLFCKDFLSEFIGKIVECYL